MTIRGSVRVDRKTKELVKRLKPGEIAVIVHQDLDEVAADSLVKKHVRAVLNCRQSISGRYPNLGPKCLVEHNVPLIDNLGEDFAELIREGDEIEIQDNLVLKHGKVLGSAILLDADSVAEKMEWASQNLSRELARFIENTVTYALKEKRVILGQVPTPQTRVSFAGRHALVVVRGRDYKDDLNTIRSYIAEVRPVLIGVDGGADALLECGYRPDLIIGDMDSISDQALTSGAEIIVHAYTTGEAPGLQHIRDLGLEAQVFAFPGTSEDVAMLLAYEKGAELLVAVGTHSNLIDFLEKGRKGMASTFLVRMKVGSSLVDAKGVSRLYSGRVKARHFLQIVAAALLPVTAVSLVSPPAQFFFRLLVLKARLAFNV